MAEASENTKDDASVDANSGGTQPPPCAPAEQSNAVKDSPSKEASSKPDQAAKPASAPDKEEPPKPLTCTATLLDQFLIDGAKPLPHLDSPCARAYTVTDQKDPDAKLFALICESGMPIRVGTIRKMQITHFNGVIPLLDWDYVYWEPFKRATAAIIMEQPLGGSLMDAIASGATKISEYDVAKRIILPAMEGIASLLESGFVHRAIRADNMYFMDESREEIVLGDCITTPPGYDQPIIYEPIERSMAPPSGRGRGSTADDMYALGISLVMILLGYNPLRKYTTMDILAAKVEKGTYGAVCGSARLPISVIELLRGLMIDDENQRWDAEQTAAWAGGHKKSPLQRQGQRKASSPYAFNKQGHFSPRTLAYAFASKYEKAFKILKSDKNFEGWIRRSLEDENTADIYKALMDHATSMAGSPTAEPDIVISRICMLLDPGGPIRYRGYALMPDALGSALAIETMVRNNPEPIIEIINREIYEFWFKTQEKTTNDHLDWRRTFVRCRDHMKSKHIGYGIERCLYEENEFIPCQSELIIEENVSDCEELLWALDKISGKVETGTRPIDKHVAAFIAARFMDDVRLHLRAIASQTIERSAIGILSLFAFVQRKTKTRALLGLTSWVGGQVGPAINTYHSRSTRRELEREIPQVVRKGSLPDLFGLIESAEKRRTDSTSFAEAQAEFAEAENEIYDIIGGEGEKNSKLLLAGQKTTAMISVLLSMTVVTMLFMLDVF